MNSVIIVDDNLIFIKRLYNAIIKQISNISCISLATSGKEAIQYIKEYKPDIVLLDLEMPNGNGIDVINFIADNQYLTKVIIISAYYEQLLNKYHEKSSIIKAVLPKPLNVRQLIEIINNIIDEDRCQIISNYILKELDKFNFNRKSIGYKYLITTTNIVIQEKKIKFNLEQDIYNKVAKVYDISHSNTIKWSVDKMIKQMYHNTDKDKICRYFHTNKDDKITAKLFITTIFDNYYN